MNPFPCKKAWKKEKKRDAPLISRGIRRNWRGNSKAEKKEGKGEGEEGSISLSKMKRGR